VIRDVWDFQPDENYDVLAAATSENEEDDEEENASQHLEDEAPPATVKLEALVPDDYDEDAATTTTMELSKAEEEARWSWPGLEDVLQAATVCHDGGPRRLSATATTTAAPRATAGCVGRPDGATSRSTCPWPLRRSMCCSRHNTSAGDPCLGARRSSTSSPTTKKMPEMGINLLGGFNYFLCKL
jgi:hypothetical protein